MLSDVMRTDERTKYRSQVGDRTIGSVHPPPIIELPTTGVYLDRFFL